MPFIEAYGMRGNVLISGEGQEGASSLVFIHGAGGNCSVWYPQQEYFGANHRVYVVELPGHGAVKGEGADKIASYTLWVAGLLFQLQVDAPYLIGHSMGGAIAMELALGFHLDLAGLVLAATGARLKVDPRILNGIRDDFEKTVGAIGHYAFGPDTAESVIREGVEMMGLNAPELLYGDFLACDRFDRMASVHEISAPTLVICGGQDVLTPAKYSRYLADRIAGARLEVIDRAGHMVMLERPTEFNQRLEGFFKAAGARHA